MLRVRPFTGPAPCTAQPVRVCRPPVALAAPSSAWQLHGAPCHCKRAVAARATRPEAEELRRMEADRVRLRSEAEAPWRIFRLIIFGYCVVSAGVGTLVSIPQLIGALGGAPGAMQLEEVGQNLAINIGAITLFGFLLTRDLQAKKKQMARLEREQALASLKLQLANGKRLRLGDLQGAVRAVLVAGTPEQVAAAVAAAEPFKEELKRRGVMVIPVPVYGAEAADAIPAGLSSIPAADLRWTAAALKPDRWKAWFDQQLELASKAVKDNGLYVGLRLDGRVRASGMGCPPWARFAAELAPLEGEDRWTGFFDGFDGKV